MTLTKRLLVLGKRYWAWRPPWYVRHGRELFMLVFGLWLYVFRPDLFWGLLVPKLYQLFTRPEVVYGLAIVGAVWGGLRTFEFIRKQWLSEK